MANDNTGLSTRNFPREACNGASMEPQGAGIECILYLDAQERQPEVRTHMSDIPAEQERQFSRYKGNLGVYNVKHLIISSAAFLLHLI